MSSCSVEQDIKIEADELYSLKMGDKEFTALRFSISAAESKEVGAAIEVYKDDEIIYDTLYFNLQPNKILEGESIFMDIAYSSDINYKISTFEIR